MSNVATPQRIATVDLGRGAVMAIMALDHTRTFFTNVSYNPSDLSQTYPALFLTRLLSHLCTPMFMLLAGTGAYLMAQTRSRSAAAWFLVTRGAMLIVFEMTLVRWGWYFNLDYRQTRLQILWAIGGSMILLAPLIVVPSRLVGGIGLTITAFHNLLPAGQSFGLPGWMWAPLYERGQELSIVPGALVTINFPILPLFGVMSIGYALGEVFKWPIHLQRRTLLGLGIGCAVVFIGLRATTGYGDPVKWSGGDGLRALLSFFVLTKHPLSLLMSLAMLGIGLIWLGAVRAERPWWRPVIVIGRTPMYFYLIHVPVIHALALGYAARAYGRTGWLLTSPFDRTAEHAVPPGWGFGLSGVYLIWLAVMVVLYPSCAWLARVKSRSKSPWLSYL